MFPIPDKLKNFKCYNEGGTILGVTDIALPPLAYMTEEIQGAGIAGAIDSPVVGHFQSMAVTINWRTVFEKNLRFVAPRRYHLDFRASVQFYDDEVGELPSQAVQIMMRVLPKTFTLGNLTVATGMGTAGEFELLYIKIAVEGKDVVEIDKLNFICRMPDERGNMVDYLAKTRRDLGMA